MNLSIMNKQLARRNKDFVAIRTFLSARILGDSDFMLVFAIQCYEPLSTVETGMFLVSLDLEKPDSSASRFTRSFRANNPTVGTWALATLHQ